MLKFEDAKVIIASLALVAIFIVVPLCMPEITLAPGDTYPYPPVGGEAKPINAPVDKPEIAAFWMWLSIIILSLASAAYILFMSRKERDAETNS